MLGLVDHRFRQRKGDQEPAVVRPVHAAFLATFAEHLTPVLDDACLEHAQGSIIEDHSEVLIVTVQHLT